MPVNDFANGISGFCSCCGAPRIWGVLSHEQECIETGRDEQDPEMLGLVPPLKAWAHKIREAGENEDGQWLTVYSEVLAVELEKASRLIAKLTTHQLENTTIITENTKK